MTWLVSLLCRLGWHTDRYYPYVEHRIIDGPPRRFCRVFCICCGREYESRAPWHCERAWKGIP